MRGKETLHSSNNNGCQKEIDVKYETKSAKYSVEKVSKSLEPKEDER